MKGIDIFCASQAATAICLSMEQNSSSSPSSSSSTNLLGGGRAIDRYNPIIRDSRRVPKSLPPCTNSQQPISPKPHKFQPKKKNQKVLSLKGNGDDQDKKSNETSVSVKQDYEKTRKSCESSVSVVRKSWSCTKPGGFISPSGSTRYLLSDKILFNSVSDSEPSLKLFAEETSQSKNDIGDEVCDEKLASSSSPPENQVVVLRVSLHCRGCEKKMRKHISRMEGVTSFNIDFAAKKVTVSGNVTPLSVLASISKVKNAQLWSPTIASSSTPTAVNFSNSEIKNEYKGAAGA